MEPLPERRTPVHFPAIERHNAPVIFFVTACTQSRKPLLAQVDVHELLVETWRQASEWRVGRYVIMPDHLHLFCSPNGPEAFSLNKWVQYWKSRSSQRWPRRSEQPIWQKSFWDTQLRGGDNYEEKWEYVRTNPVRAGLVLRAEDWPFSGEIERLEW